MFNYDINYSYFQCFPFFNGGLFSRLNKKRIHKDTRYKMSEWTNVCRRVLYCMYKCLKFLRDLKIYERFIYLRRIPWYYCIIIKHACMYEHNSMALCTACFWITSCSMHSKYARSNGKKTVLLTLQRSRTGPLSLDAVYDISFYPITPVPFCIDIL